MRVLAGMVTMLAASTVHAAPQTMIGDVEYAFTDQHGMGWAAVSGKVTITLVLDGKEGSLKITGKRRWVNGQLTAGPSPNASPAMKSDQWEGDVDETFPLHDVARTDKTIAFKLDPVHDHLTGTCAPTKIDKLARTTLYECSITGFQWKTIANLPELHHPIVLDANVKAKTRIVNTMTGAAKVGFGKRTVTEAKPPKR